MEEIKNNIYYILIFVLSLLTLLVAPLFGSVVGLAFILPTTPAAWAVYIITKLFVAIVNVLLFHCFVRQGKVNIRNNPQFLAAQEMLGKLHLTYLSPRSPATFLRQIYFKKGTTVFMTSLLTAFVLTNAILTYDITSLVSYSITIVMGIIFGILKMKDVETYWTEEYYNYAVAKCAAQTEEEEKENDLQQQHLS